MNEQDKSLEKTVPILRQPEGRRDYDAEIESAKTVTQLIRISHAITGDESIGKGEKDRLLHKCGLRAWNGCQG